MNKGYRRWTLAEIFKLREMLSEGKTAFEIAPHLKCATSRVQDRIALERMTDEEKKAKYQRRVAAGHYIGRKSESHHVGHAVIASARPTQEMLDEAQRRADAPKSLTASFFGDPAPGYSQLDRRQSA